MSALGDTGSQLDDAAGDAGIYPDSRSNRGGSEPEALNLAHYRGRTFATVTFERANAVALLDVREPSTPEVIDIAPGRRGTGGCPVLPSGKSTVCRGRSEAAGTLCILEVLKKKPGRQVGGGHAIPPSGN